MPEFPFATAETFAGLMANPEMAGLWLTDLGVRDSERAFDDLRDLVDRGLPMSLLASLADHLNLALPRCPDPGMALTNLERFISASPDPVSTLATLAEVPRSVEIAVQLFSTSQFFSELMIQRPGPARLAPGRGRPPRPRAPSIDDLWLDLIQAIPRPTRPGGSPSGGSRLRETPPDRLQRHRPRPTRSS